MKPRGITYTGNMSFNMSFFFILDSLHDKFCFKTMPPLQSIQGQNKSN